ncbi:MAG: DoxX family protein [Propionibacteriales bacterium]|nr:DoxX family protein [Propionibacteriales bacterium]
MHRCSVTGPGRVVRLGAALGYVAGRIGGPSAYVAGRTPRPCPKFFGEATAVEIFDEIGIGDWFRYFVATCELAGAIGLLIRALSGLAAIGLSIVMVGAIITQIFIMDDLVTALTPAFLLVLFVLIARGRWPETRTVASRLKR